MPEFIHTFQSGRMNKDLDERLIPNGEYRDALNLDLANSDGSNVGTLQNVKGNIEQRRCDGCSDNWSSDYIDELSNPVVIGSIRHDKEEKIYWFIASDNISAIAEYDQKNNIVEPVLVDTNNILKFSESYLITGINILDKFLFWTDDQTEPKKINIDKFKAGSCDFVTHTKVGEWNPSQNNYVQVNCSGTPSIQPNFVEADITVIKKSPLNSLTLDKAASKYGADIPGTGVDPLRTQYTVSNQQNFTYVLYTTSAPNDYIPIDTYGQYLANIESDPDYYDDSSLGANWNGEITFSILSPPSYGVDPDTGDPVWQNGDILSLNADHVDLLGEHYKYQLKVLITNVNGDNITCQIQSISSRILRFQDNNQQNVPVIFDVVLEEKEPMFEYVFPRFAYRWKYIDNEYSCFSPFTEVAFIPNKFEYVSSDGHNIGMTNNIRKLILKNINWGTEEVSEIDILYKESNSNNVYVVDTIKKVDYTQISATGETLITEFEIKNELIGATVEGNQILRPWDNVPRKAKSQEIVGNRIIYGNYVQNYSVDTVDLSTDISRKPHPANTVTIEGGLSISNDVYIGDAEPSLKSIRTYQVGVVYKDQYGRETPVFSSKNASKYIDISDSDSITKLLVKPNSDAPSFATHYKYFVKETSNEYYNLALDRFYPAEDGNVWLSFPSSERNKLDEETYLIMKKQHDNNKAVETLNRYKILAIENEAPDFVASFESTKFFGAVTLQNNIEVGFITLRVSLVNNTEDTRRLFQESLTSANNLRISKGGFETNEYGIEKGGQTASNNIFSIKLKSPIASDGGWLESLSVNDTVDLTIFEQERKNLPEFEGRFFAKINRDFAFDENIIATFAALEKQYVVLDEIDLQGGKTSSGDARGYWWGDAGWPKNEAGCTNDASEKRALGQGSWGGVGSANGVTIRQNYRPPTRSHNWFGFTYIGRKSGNIDDFIGSAHNHFGSLQGGYFNNGAKIRFYNTVDGKYSRIYQVEESYGDGRGRGAKARIKLECQSRDNAGNKAYTVVARLNRPIQEDWFPAEAQAGNTGWNLLNSKNIAIQVVTDVYDGDNKILTSSNPAIFETEPKEAVDLELYYEASNALPISQHGTQFDELNWFNCYSFGNGAESNRIRDDFNAVYIDKGPKVSTILDEPYSEERRGSGMIFSQIYNSTSGINRLNQFIQALPITKDLNPIYGTIQKLHARDTDAIVLCEDKCLRILANKDALYNADGNVNLTGNNAVLGQAVPYAGEFGISKNPESFAQYAFRSYFTDKNRGAVIRLSMDGITNIADKGMSDFFADNLRVSTKIIGSYDDDKDIYNLTLNNLSQSWSNTFSEDKDYQLQPDCNVDTRKPITQTTVSFKESVDGWTSRKSFIQESGVTLNNRYYTFKKGRLWEHGLNVLANNFYGVQYDSAFNLIINENPQSVKGYSTLNYTGTQSRRLEYLNNNKWYSISEVNFNKIIPTSVKQKQPGWYVNYIKTDLEGGEIKEFEKKEGKYFNYIKGLQEFNDCEFIGEGIGPPVLVECTTQDYNFTITIDESCSGLGDPDGGGITPNSPDEQQFFYNYWWVIKQDQNLGPAIITDETSAQDAKCVIENLYNNIPIGSYDIVTNQGVSFSYFLFDGLVAGTQMYNSETEEPISSAGTYLFTMQGSDQSTSSIDHGSLDLNNSSTAPNSYAIMILNSSGVIQSFTQYNTIDSCPDEGPGCEERPNNRTYFQTSFGSLPYDGSSIVIQNTDAFKNYASSTAMFSGIQTYMSSWDSNYSSSCPSCPKSWNGNIFYYSGQTLGLGSVLYYLIVQPNGCATRVKNFRGIQDINNSSSCQAPYGASYYSNLSSMPNKYYLIETNDSGVVTTYQRINTL